jgi:hypothetical protein
MICLRAPLALSCACLFIGLLGLHSFASQTPGQLPATPDDTRPVQSATPPGQTQAEVLANAQPDTLPMQFESHGLQYEALTKEGVTLMFAPLPPHIKDYNVVQITVTNGSPVSWTVRPADFTFIREDGTILPTVSADEVVSSLLEKAGRNDVVKLQLMYEDSIRGLANYHSTSGYEKRRQAAMTMFTNSRFKAAAAASALSLVPVKLKPGDSTDGAVFVENRSKEHMLGSGRFVAQTCGQVFAFRVYSDPKLRQ